MKGEKGAKVQIKSTFVHYPLTKKCVHITINVTCFVIYMNVGCFKMKDKSQVLIGLFIAFINVFTVIFTAVCYMFDNDYKSLMNVLCIVLVIFEVFIYRKKIIERNKFWYGYFTASFLYFLCYAVFMIFNITNSEITFSLKIAPFVYGYPVLVLIPLVCFLKTKDYKFIFKLVLVVLSALIYPFFPGFLMTVI